MAGRPRTRARKAAEANGVALMEPPVSIPDMDEFGNELPESLTGVIDPATQHTPVELTRAQKMNEKIAADIAVEAAQMDASRARMRAEAEAKRLGRHVPQVIDDGPARPVVGMPANAPVPDFVQTPGDVVRPPEFEPEDEDPALDVVRGDPIGELPQPRQEIDGGEEEAMTGHVSVEDRLAALERAVMGLVRKDRDQQVLNARAEAEFIDYECVASVEGRGCGQIDRYPKQWNPTMVCKHCGGKGLLPLS